jgi:hypothetical protein
MNERRFLFLLFSLSLPSLVPAAVLMGTRRGGRIKAKYIRGDVNKCDTYTTKTDSRERKKKKKDKKSFWFQRTGGETDERE